MEIPRRLAVLLAVATLLSACAAGPKYEAVSDSFPPVASGKGRIFFYRPAVFFGDGVQPNINLNGTVVGASQPGGFFFVDRDPGDYEVLTSTEVDEKLSLTLNDAQVRYVKMTIQMGLLVGRVIPTLVDPAVGLQELKGLSYTGDRVLK